MSVVNSLYHTFNNPLVQESEVQRWALGASLFAGSYYLLSSPTSGQSSDRASEKQEQTASQKVRWWAKKAFGCVLGLLALRLVYVGIKQGIPVDSSSISDWMMGRVPERKFLVPHSYELLMQSHFSQDITTFNSDNSRPKLLWLNPYKDGNGAFSPCTTPNEILMSFGKKFDIKYMVIDHPLQVCQEINQGKKVGEIANVILGGHGNPTSMSFGSGSIGTWNLFDSRIPSDCFEGLSQNAKIFLDSCSTGVSYIFPNFAQYISFLSKREVVAPTQIAWTKDMFELDPDSNTFSLGFKGDVSGGLYSKSFAPPTFREAVSWSR